VPNNNRNNYNVNNLITILNERNASILNVIVRYLNSHINNNFLNSSYFNRNNSERRNYNVNLDATDTTDTTDDANMNTNANNTYSNNTYENITPLVSPITRYTQQLYIPRTNNTNRNFFSRFLEPVEVYPTAYQVERATQHVRYGDIENPLNNSCPITLERFHNEDMVTIIRHCNHIFRTNEINNWFTHNCRCPICRYDIREFVHDNNNNNNNNNNDNDNNDNNNNNNSTAESVESEESQSLSPQSLLSSNSIHLDSSNNAIQEMVDRLLHTLTYDSSFNSYLDSREEDASSNDILATFYFYR
jgi:hypothetical protein